MIAKSGFRYARMTIKKVRNKFLSSEYELMKRKFHADNEEYKLRFNYDLSEESIVLELGGWHRKGASDFFSKYRFGN